MNNSYKLTYLYGGIESSRMLIGAIQALYLLSCGVTIPSIALLKVIYCIVMILADVPAGLLADLYGNKKCVAFGCAAITLYYPLSMQAPNMSYLILGEVAYCIGLCFVSSALDAWTANTVKIEYPKITEKINYFYHLRNEVMSIGSMVMAPLGVGILHFTTSMKFVYCVATVLMTLMLAFSLAIPNHSGKTTKLDFLKSAQQLFINNFKSRNIVIYIVLMSFITVIYQPIYHFWQPLFINIINNATVLNKDKLIYYSNWLCLVFFSYSLCVYLVNHYVRTYLINKNNMASLGLSTIILTTIFIFILATNKSIVPCIIVFSLCHGCLSLFATIVDACFINAYQGTGLATIISTANVVGRLSSAFFLYIFSLIIQFSTLESVFIVIGGLGICTLFIFQLNFRYLISEKSLTTAIT